MRARTITGRIIALALALAVGVLCCAPARAEGKPEEIVFRGIPWGSTAEEARTALEADTGESVTFRKAEPPYMLKREELGYYNSADGVDYYEIPGGGLTIEGVYVDEIHLFFREGRLVQAAYFFRADPENLKRMSEALDRQYGPHTLSVSRQVTDVDLYTWEADGRTVTAETIQIEAGILGYYSDIVIVYADQKDA